MNRLLVILVSVFFVPAALALRLPLPPKNNDLSGQVQFASVQLNDTFADVARRYDVGYYELVEANPEVNPDQPAPGTVLIIPTQFLLPHIPRAGIVMNLATMRLYYFPQGKNYFYTYPIGIGKEDWQTPLGVLRIIQKIVNPVWVVPESVMKYREQHGDPVPRVMPSGPDNPLGDFAMRLSKPTYLIHGTNDPSSVGRRSSAGCIHLYPEDIKELFAMTPVDTRVLIINQPYVAGWNDRKLYVAAHLPLEEERAELANTSAVVEALINSMLDNDEEDSKINWKKATEIIKEHTGIPAIIGFDQGAEPGNVNAYSASSNE